MTVIAFPKAEKPEQHLTPDGHMCANCGLYQGYD